MIVQKVRGAVAVGSPAPDVTLQGPAGEHVSLSSFWSSQPTALVFVRHFG